MMSADEAPNLSAVFWNAGVQAGLDENINEVKFIKSLLRELKSSWLEKHTEALASEQTQLAAKLSNMALGVSTALVEIEKYEMIKK